MSNASLGADVGLGKRLLVKHLPGKQDPGSESQYLHRRLAGCCVTERGGSLDPVGRLVWVDQ